MDDSSRFRKILHSVRAWGWRGVVGGVFAVLTAVGTVIAIYKDGPEVAEDLWNRMRGKPKIELAKVPVIVIPAPPAPPAAPAPARRITTASIDPSDCVADPVAMLKMIEAGGAPIERTFNGLFKSKDACMVLEVTAKRAPSALMFATGSFWRFGPTVHVEVPQSDFYKYKIGDKLRVTGKMLRYRRTPNDEPDELHLTDVRVSKAD